MCSVSPVEKFYFHIALYITKFFICVIIRYLQIQHKRIRNLRSNFRYYTSRNRMLYYYAIKKQKLHNSTRFPRGAEQPATRKIEPTNRQNLGKTLSIISWESWFYYLKIAGNLSDGNERTTDRLQNNCRSTLLFPSHTFTSVLPKWVYIQYQQGHENHHARF